MISALCGTNGQPGSETSFGKEFSPLAHCKSRRWRNLLRVRSCCAHLFKLRTLLSGSPGQQWSHSVEQLWAALAHRLPPLAHPPPILCTQHTPQTLLLAPSQLVDQFSSWIISSGGSWPVVDHASWQVVDHASPRTSQLLDHGKGDGVVGGSSHGLPVGDGGGVVISSGLGGIAQVGETRVGPGADTVKVAADKEAGRLHGLARVGWLLRLEQQD